MQERLQAVQASSTRIEELQKTPSKQRPVSTDFTELRFMDWLAGDPSSATAATSSQPSLAPLEQTTQALARQALADLTSLPQSSLLEATASVTEVTDAPQISKPLSDKQQLDLEPIDWAFVQQAFQSPQPLDNQQAVPMLQFQQAIAWQAGQGAQEAHGILPNFGLSEKMQAMLKKAAEQGGNLRISVDDESSVLLKIRQGRVSAQFVTRQMSAALGLEQQLAALRKRLADNDLPVDTVDVVVEERAHQQNRQQRHQHSSQADQPEA